MVGTGLVKSLPDLVQLHQNTMKSYKSNCDLVLKPFPRGSSGLQMKTKSIFFSYSTNWPKIKRRVHNSCSVQITRQIRA